MTTQKIYSMIKENGSYLESYEILKKLNYDDDLIEMVFKIDFNVNIKELIRSKPRGNKIDKLNKKFDYIKKMNKKGYLTEKNFNIMVKYNKFLMDSHDKVKYEKHKNIIMKYIGISENMINESEYAHIDSDDDE